MRLRILQRGCQCPLPATQASAHAALASGRARAVRDSFTGYRVAIGMRGLRSLRSVGVEVDDVVGVFKEFSITLFALPDGRFGAALFGDVSRNADNT